MEPAVSDIPALGDQNDPEDEVAGEIQEQHVPPEPDQRAEELEPDEQPGEQRYPLRIRQEPVRLGFNT